MELSKSQRAAKLRKLVIEFLQQVPEDQTELDNCKDRLEEYEAKRRAILKSVHLHSWEFVAVKDFIDCEGLLGFRV